MEGSGRLLRPFSILPAPYYRPRDPRALSPLAGETAACRYPLPPIEPKPSGPLPHPSHKRQKSLVRTNRQIDPTFAAIAVPAFSPLPHVDPQTNNSTQANTALALNPAGPSARSPAVQSHSDNFRACIPPTPDSAEFPARSAAAHPPSSTSVVLHP